MLREDDRWMKECVTIARRQLLDEKMRDNHELEGNLAFVSVNAHHPVTWPATATVLR